MTLTTLFLDLIWLIYVFKNCTEDKIEDITSVEQHAPEEVTEPMNIGNTIIYLHIIHMRL